MARELSIEFEVLGSTEADAAIARLALGLQKAGNSATEAAEKAERFEKAYREGTARKKAKAELDELVGATKATASATDGLTAAVLRYAAPAVVVEAARKTLAWADNIEEMAKRTNLSVESVQQLTKVADKNGSSFATMAGLIQNVEQRLASHNKKAEETVRLLGMTPEALLRMDPLERLRAIAKGLADIKDPAQKSAAEVALFGRQADGASVALEALANGADKVESALGSDFIRAGAEAQDMLETLTNKALDLAKAFFLLPGVIGNKMGELGRDSTIGTMFQMMGFHGSRAVPMPGLPGAPGGGWGMPSPLAVPGDPFAAGGVGGNSMSFIEQTLKLPKGSLSRGGGGGKVLPFKAKAAMGTTAAAIFAMQNSPGSFNAGRMPFAFSPGGNLSDQGASFNNLMMFPGSVPMNAPGAAGGGIGGWLKNNKARVGIGLGTMAAGFLGNKIGGKAGGALSGAAQGAQMGMMFGPWGAAVGGVIGGVAGWIGAGKKAKNAKNAELGEVFKNFQSKDFIAIQKEADRLGLSMKKALDAKTVKDFGAAVDAVTEKIKEINDLESQIADLTERTTVDFDKMNAVVQEFGLDVSKLGPAFQQAMMDKEAQRIIDAMAIMEKGGADMTGVLEGMADELSKVVQDSIKFGTTIPENMRPWIEELIKSGKLLDENGQVITDISKIKWGAAMESDMSKLTKKLDELVSKLKEMVEAFNAAAGAARDLGGVDYNQPNNPNPSNPNPSGNNESGMAVGGQAGRDFRRPGYGDVFPALLRRGETVLPPGVHRGGVAINGDIHVNGGYGSRADAVEEIGEAVVKYMERRGARLVA